MASLSLFRFPQLVLINIINSMNPAEQFLIALCSRKAYAYIKNFRSKAIELTLSTDSYRVVVLDEQKRIYKWLGLNVASEPYDIRKEIEKSIDIRENHSVRSYIDNLKAYDCLLTCWEKRSVGLKNMLELATDLFCIDHVKSIEIQGAEDTWIFNWLKERQITFGNVFFYEKDYKFTDDDIKYIILNCTTQQLHMHARPTDDFQIEHFPNKFGLFSCVYGFWITIHNLMAIDCVELRIYRKHFTSQQVNQFLKHWINGGSQRLQFLTIDVKKYNQNDLFADIQNYLTPAFGESIYTSPYKTTWTFNGFYLRRIDGVIASIQYFPVAKLVYFGVWPDANGNQF